MVACESVVLSIMVWVCPFLDSYAYGVAFLVNLVGSASIFLPVPGFALVFFLGGLGFNPWLLGIFGGLGAAIGEFTGYAIGVGGRRLSERKKSRFSLFRERSLMDRAREWSERRGMFLVVFLFAASPLPDDVVGILAGALGYSFKKFFVATLAGKIVLYIIIAWGGLLGSDWVLENLAGGL